MTLRLWLSCGALSALVGVLYACSSDETNPTVNDEKCTTYCTRMKSLCKGSDVQFAGIDTDVQYATCLSVCGNWPAGAAGSAADDLSCRSGILSSTTEVTDPAAISAGCSSAGPFSDACGGRCETFCRINATACSGSLKQFASESECVTQCKTLKLGFDKPLVSPSVASGNTAACRGYHTMAALGQSATDPGLHCPHTKIPTSAVCVDTVTPVGDGGSDAKTD